MDVETKLFSLKHTTALTDVRKEKKSVKTKKKLGCQQQQKEKRNGTDDASE